MVASSSFLRERKVTEHVVIAAFHGVGTHAPYGGLREDHFRLAFSIAIRVVVHIWGPRISKDAGVEYAGNSFGGNV